MRVSCNFTPSDVYSFKLFTCIIQLRILESQTQTWFETELSLNFQINGYLQVMHHVLMLRNAIEVARMTHHVLSRPRIFSLMKTYICKKFEDWTSKMRNLKCQEMIFCRSAATLQSIWVMKSALKCKKLGISKYFFGRGLFFTHTLTICSWHGFTSALTLALQSWGVARCVICWGNYQ